MFNSNPSTDQGAFTRIMDGMVDMHQHLCDYDVTAGSEGYYLNCYCGNGASCKDIALALKDVVPVEVKIVGKVGDLECLGVFLTKPPRQLNFSEVLMHVIWGNLE